MDAKSHSSAFEQDTAKTAGPHGLAETSGSGRTLASILTDSVRSDIIMGALQPGQRLRLRELAQRYQVGVNPLREALSRLALSGFVEAEDQRGFRVTGVSEAELRDLTRTRQTIECEALRSSIAGGDLDWEARVLAAFHRLDRIGMTMASDQRRLNPAWQSAHEAFHDALLSGCDSPWLLKFVAILRQQTARYIYLSVRNPEAPKRNVTREHRSLLEAVLARDADRACALLSAHFAATTNLVLGEDAASARKKKRS
jgi:DNA-binding GntR family transcriptional regulator